MPQHHEPIDPGEALLAGRASGRSLGTQVMDLLKFMMQPGRVNPQEYFYYALFDDQLYTDEERFRFVSDDYAIDAILHTAREDWYCVAKDKLLNYQLILAQGLPVPTITAVVDPIRVFPGARSIRNEDQLVDYLETATYPLFAKPVTGIQSFGSGLLKSFDPETRLIHFRKDEPKDVREYARWVWNLEGLTGGDGFLFQELLEPDSLVKEWVGDRLSGVRLVVQIADNTPRVTHCVWKVMTGENYADNYWRGNLAAQVNPETGEVLRMVRGHGLDLESIRKHPDTGVELVGKTLPHWERILQIVDEGARLMPKIRLQGWDIALAAQGPVVLEGNLGTGFGLIQLSSGRGMLTPEFKAFLERSKAELAAELEGGQVV